MPLYFAYGLNMDVAAMRERCPRSTALGLARLPRHRFIITTDGYASVIRDPRESVHGVLWDCALGDIRTLDKFEELASGLYIKINQAGADLCRAQRAHRKAPSRLSRKRHRQRQKLGFARDLPCRHESLSEQADSG